VEAVQFSYLYLGRTAVSWTLGVTLSRLRSTCHTYRSSSRWLDSGVWLGDSLPYMKQAVSASKRLIVPYTHHNLLVLPRIQLFASTMSQVPSTSTSPTNFETIFSTALKAYKKQTKKDIASHPLATELKSCDSSSAIIAILRTQVQNFDRSQGADDSEKWTKWLDPTVNVLFAFSATLGNSVGVVSPATLCYLRSTL
jgi:hypothetical protein